MSEMPHRCKLKSQILNPKCWASSWMIKGVWRPLSTIALTVKGLLSALYMVTSAVASSISFCVNLQADRAKLFEPGWLISFEQLDISFWILASEFGFKKI